MKELNFEYIGRRIRDIRISKGITQEYVANYANVNVSHISNIENNRVKISLTTLVNVCNALEVTIDYILNAEYVDASTPLEQSILTVLQKCDNSTKERVLKIIKILQEDL